MVTLLTVGKAASTNSRYFKIVPLFTFLLFFLIFKLSFALHAFVPSISILTVVSNIGVAVDERSHHKSLLVLYHDNK